jgi:hypothetical protein
MAKYDQPEENEWVTPVMKCYKLACCDCGLVHEIDFRLTIVNKKVVLQFRVRRNNRSTGQMRRHQGIKVIRK